MSGTEQGKPGSLQPGQDQNDSRRTQRTVLAHFWFLESLHHRPKPFESVGVLCGPQVKPEGRHPTIALWRLPRRFRELQKGPVGSPQKESPGRGRAGLSESSAS
jgi:hypothetical protein